MKSFSAILISFFISQFSDLVACCQIKTCYIFLQIYLLAFRYLQFFRYNSICLLSDRDLLQFLLKMPALDRNAKVACPNCGTKVSKQNLSVHKKSCYVGTLFCSKCPNFSTKSQNDFNYHIAKKHGATKPAVAHIRMICKDKFIGFYPLRQHKSQVHGHNIKTSDDSSPLLEGIDDDSLKEELRACQHFLVDSQLEKGRQRVFNFALDSFSAEKINSKLDYVFQQLKCAAKINLAFGFVLKNIEDASCRYFLHTRITLCWRSLNC